MKIGSTYEYPAISVRFTVAGFDRKSRSYSVTYGDGSKHAISQGSPMHRGSIEVPA